MRHTALVNVRTQVIARDTRAVIVAKRWSIPSSALSNSNAPQSAWKAHSKHYFSNR